MDWLRSESDNDPGEEAREIGCGWREIVCCREYGPMICVNHFGARFRSALSDPCGQSTAANDIEIGIGTRLGIEHGGA